MTSLVIVGAGGHGRETLDIVEALNAAGDTTYKFVGFVDDGEVDAELLARRNATLLGGTDLLAELDVEYVIGIGDSATRAVVDSLLTTHDRHAATLVHPNAVVASDNRLDPGVLIAAGAHVTTNVHLGRHTHLNVGAVVSHDCRLGDHVTVSPGVYLNGDVTIEDGAFLGTGAVVTPGITVGAAAVVGAGAVVTGDVAAGTTVVGVPARQVWTPR
jgi:sugar O-acyltransferase (sialic acid O-acetyltransferase NeuD family)